MYVRPDAFYNVLGNGLYRMLKSTTILIVFFIGAAIFIAPHSTCAAECPVGDLTGDCRVDIEDLSEFVLQWLDGSTIGGHDIQVHWKLDEQTGTFANDSSGNNHRGLLQNAPQWQPNGGKRNGAILLDGIDDYISADFVLNPADGPLSAFAWIKGGAPRNVIITQTNGSGT